MNEKTLDPAGGALRCQLDTSLRHLPNDDLNQFKNRSLRCALHQWENIKSEYIKNLMMCKDCRVSLCLWCYCAFHEVKHVGTSAVHFGGGMRAVNILSGKSMRTSGETSVVRWGGPSFSTSFLPRLQAISVQLSRESSTCNQKAYVCLSPQCLGSHADQEKT